MNDKDFVFDFYIGDNDEENTNESIPDNELPQEVESEILLNTFYDDEHSALPQKQSFFAKFKNWWQNLKKWHKATIISSIAVITAISIVLGFLHSGMGYNYNRITSNYEDLGIENIIDKDIVNVALFGIDTRSLDSFKGNSDSIMVLSLNTKTKKVKIISLMRDSFVPITYDGNTIYSKINSAYSRGGPELAIKVINSNFGLDITEYATVNFFGMVDIIDAIGGIEAELTEEEVVSSSVYFYALNGAIAEICTALDLSAKDNFILTPGKHHLNGVQAVAYSRIRKVKNIWGTNNDYGRTDRQRYVMEQMFNKALTMEKSQYIKLAKSLIPCTETSLTYREIIGLAFDMLLESPSFLQARIPRDDMLMRAPSTRAGSVVYYDLAFAKELIHAFIYDDITFDQYVEENGVEKNDWYTEAIASKNSSGNNSGNKNNSSSSKKPSKDDKNTSDSSEYFDEPLDDEMWDEEPIDPDFEDDYESDELYPSDDFDESSDSNDDDKDKDKDKNSKNESTSDKTESDSLNQSDGKDKTNPSDKDNNSSDKSGLTDSSDKNNSGSSSKEPDNDYSENNSSGGTSSENTSSEPTSAGDSSSNSGSSGGSSENASSDSNSSENISSGSTSNNVNSNNSSSSNSEQSSSVGGNPDNINISSNESGANKSPR
ncbi:MAG: LCP family protein [Clostridia bacterium]|nr:LCP family protein [Clostridia bacterium]